MRVALTVWNDRIAPVFDSATGAVVLDTDSGMTHGSVALPRSPEAKVALLAASGVRMLVCGAVSAETATALENAGLRLLPFVCGEVREVIAALRGGSIDADRFAMPGCCGRRRRHRNGKR
jgi:predicted Fe-Mo cluster-binding NifX family protein